jgi:hypothetical protein
MSFSIRIFHIRNIALQILIKLLSVVEDVATMKMTHDFDFGQM